MPATDLDLLTTAALRSGGIAKSYFGQSPQVWDKADNAGPVTAADLAVNDMLTSTLQSARPDYGWLSEETEDGTARLQTTRQFVVDPIDGTRAFIEGGKDWGHSLAVVENGAVTAAAVYIPMRDMLFAATLGGGATCNGQPITTSDTALLGDASVLSHKANFDGKYWKGGCAPNMRKAFRSSLAYRLCLVASGRFDAMLTFRPTWEWDIAAGSLIVAEARGIATTQTGSSLRFNNAHPQVTGVVAAGQLHGDIIACLHGNA